MLTHYYKHSHTRERRGNGEKKGRQNNKKTKSKLTQGIAKTLGR